MKQANGRGHEINPKSLYFSDRLGEALEGIWAHPLTIVEAPMGYGKTTAVREHLNRAGVPVLWQSVYDSGTANFWKGFSRLFTGLEETCATNLAKLGLPDDSVSRQAALELIEGIALPGKTVLVIDDLHLLSHPDVHDFIVFLVKNEIAGLHIVLITRLIAWESLDELKLKGYAHHITKETFELTPDEIAKYYKQCGISLNAYQINTLSKYTEGWISALYLLMLEFIKEGRLATDLIPNINNLVEKAIYAPLAAELQDFLIKLSIFDSFTLEQAAYIWRKPNATPLLAEILARNAFLAYNPQTKTYHLHNILINFLQRKLAGLDPLYRQELYQRAGKWYLQAGHYLEAMQCFCRCGDFDHLLETLEKDKANSIDGDHRGLLIQYFDACPRDAWASHPAALGLMGKCLFLLNERERYTRVCREFAHWIEGDAHLEPRRQNMFQGEYERLLAHAAFNDVAAIFRHYRRAHELLQGASAADLSDSMALYGSPSGLYLFYRESGKLEQTVRDALKAMAYYGEVTNDSEQAGGYFMAAERHFLMGEFDDAAIIVHQVFYPGHPEYRPGIRVRGQFLQARLALVKGDFSAVLSQLRQLRADIHENKLYLFMHSLDLCEAYIYGLLAQNAGIPPWIAAGEFKKTRLFFPALGFVHIVYGRFLLIHGEYAKLIGNAAHFIRTAAFFPNILGQIYTYIQLAAAYQQIYRNDEALSALKQALDLALPDGIAMPFVENGDYIKPLLEKLYREGLYRQDIIKILEREDTYRKVIDQISAEHFSAEKSKLTEREREIALLAGQGLTNKEIGKRLFISENTVKMALKSIYAKLSINNRTALGRHLDHAGP